jgi:hypothetical protein
MPYKRLFHNSLFGSVGEQQKMVYMDEKRKPFTSYEGYFFFFVNWKYFQVDQYFMSR